jgi:hypothetical protein
MSPIGDGLEAIRTISELELGGWSCGLGPCRRPATYIRVRRKPGFLNLTGLCSECGEEYAERNVLPLPDETN